jgi:hypothetical protein
MNCRRQTRGIALLAILFFVTLLPAYAQKLYVMSLDDYLLNADAITFSVAEIIDARKDNKSLGVVQTGLNNRPRFVVFEKPGMTEIEDLLKNSGLYSAERGLAIRFTVLKISEYTTLFAETGKAEVSIDFFVPYENHYYYITSVFTSAEPDGIGVTYKQTENFVTTLEDALIIFSNQKHEAKPDMAFTKEDLLDPYLVLREPLSMPIMTDKRIKDGYYASYEEFINNQPSISIHCLIDSSYPATVTCGGDVTEAPNLYGYARGNKVYILYHEEFHELMKRNNTFYFNGPSRISGSSEGVAQAYSGSGGSGGLIAPFIGSRRRVSDLFMLDMSTGTARNITGF